MLNPIKKLAVITTLSASIAFPSFAEIRFAVTEIAGLESLQTEFGAFKEELEKATGEPVKFFPVNGRNAAVEALANNRVDYVLVGPAEYVVFRERAGAKPVVAWQRLEYYTEIVVPAQSKVRSYKDLKGKKIAFGDIGSTSTHLAPIKLLFDQGLKQNKDYKAVNIHRNVSVEAMRRGDIDAVAVSSAHLAKIRKTFKDMSFRVIIRGPDLPNDVLVASKKVSDEQIEKMRNVFLEKQDVLLAAAMKGQENVKYGGGAFIADISDADYDYIRGMYAAIGMKAFDKFADEQ